MEGGVEEANHIPVEDLQVGLERGILISKLALLLTQTATPKAARQIISG